MRQLQQLCRRHLARRLTGMGVGRSWNSSPAFPLLRGRGGQVVGRGLPKSCGTCNAGCALLENSSHFGPLSWGKSTPGSAGELLPKLEPLFAACFNMFQRACHLLLPFANFRPLATGSPFEAPPSAPAPEPRGPGRSPAAGTAAPGRRSRFAWKPRASREQALPRSAGSQYFSPGSRACRVPRFFAWQNTTLTSNRPLLTACPLDILVV